MKSQRIITHIIIIVTTLFITNPTSAVTLNRIPSTAVIGIAAANNTTYPKCLPCPPVAACRIGYSCQPDKLLPSNGEKQQYPPDAAVAWVESLGCTELTDVPLDDQRWGNRETGEVFIQESDKCVSIYWPNGGEALFDLGLTNPVEWNDYRFSHPNGKPRGGDYTISSGKERIAFGEATGGMTVFNSIDAAPPPNGTKLSANNSYWNINGKPALLVGASNTGQPYLGTKAWIKDFIAEQANAGSNFVRSTMATYPRSPRQLYPYAKESGKYDLNKPNTEYWNGLAYLISEASKHGIIISIDVFDPWSTLGSVWDKSVWSPKNNSTYTTATGVPNEWTEKPWNKLNPIYRSPFDSKMSVVLDRRKDFVARILMSMGEHGNVVLNIENETSAPAKWTDYWANYIGWKARKLGMKNIKITDMRGGYDLNAAEMAHVASSSLYHFLEVSQGAMNGVSDQEYYDHYKSFISKQSKPSNNHKRYCWSRSWGDKYKCTDKRGVNRMWLAFFSGAAGVRHHKPRETNPAGLGLTAVTKQQIKAVNWWADNFEFWKAKPDNSVLGNRSSNEAYAMVSGDTLAIYFTGDSGGSITLPRKYNLVWYNTETSETRTSSNLNSINTAGGKWLIIAKPVGTPPPPTTGFLKSYTNPEQAKVSADGMYPFGQQMWLSGYSNSSSQLTRMHTAEFTMSGPHYQGCNADDKKINVNKLKSYEMKTFFRLYTSNHGWAFHLEKMKTAEGRDYLRGRLKRCVDVVLNNSKLNGVVAAWYGRPDEPIERSSSPIEKVREYMEFVKDYIAANDPQKRPLFWSERGDSSAANMEGNAKYTAGIMKQNYLMYGNNYDYKGGDINERFLIGQWVKDMLKADKSNSLPYTGKRRPVITTLSMYVDPIEAKYKTEEWLRKAITHDVYLSIAMGVHGINMYTWAHGESTNKIQEKHYLEVISGFSKAGLQKVFLWGDNRDDVEMLITSGPKTFDWTKYKKTHTEPSIKFRNIQYGDNRYILLVNSAKQAVTVKLSGIPSDLNIVDIIKGGSGSTTTTIQPLGVRMYKVSN